MSSTRQEMLAKIENGNAKIGIIWLRYTGLPLPLICIPKIVAWINQECTDIVAKLYGSITGVVKVKDCKTPYVK